MEEYQEVKDVGGANGAGMFAVHYLGRLEGDKEPPAEPAASDRAAAITDWNELRELLEKE